MKREKKSAFARLNAGEGHCFGNTINGDRSLLSGSPLLFAACFDRFEDLPELVTRYVPHNGYREVAPGAATGVIVPHSFSSRSVTFFETIARRCESSWQADSLSQAEASRLLNPRTFDH